MVRHGLKPGRVGSGRGEQLTAVDGPGLDERPLDLGPSEPADDAPEDGRPAEAVRVDERGRKRDAADVLDGWRVRVGHVCEDRGREGRADVEGEGERRQGPKGTCIAAGERRRSNGGTAVATAIEREKR